MDYPDDFLNKVVCGDSFEVMSLIPDRSIGLIVTDPPYTFGLASMSGRKRFKYSCWGDFMNVSYFYREIAEEAQRILRPDGALWMFINWRGVPAILKGIVDANWHAESLLVWDKECMGCGGTVGLRPTYEMAVLCPMPEFAMKNRSLPDIWREHWPSRKPHGHPAEKPVALMRKLVLESSGGIVLDPFLGSGTTIVAAKQLGREFIGIDMSRDWCDVAEERLVSEEVRLAA